MPEQPNPVVIVGAGPVGLALALGLALRGIRSIVLESKAKLSEHSKAVLVSARTIEILNEWQLLGTFKAEAEWVEELHVTDCVSQQEIFSFSFASLRPLSVGYGALVLPQNETERLLFDACVGTSLVEVRFGHALSAFDSDENGIRARVQVEEKQYVLESDFLCGCDGAHSVVREGLGLKLEGKTYDAHAILADVLIEDERDALPWPRANPHKRNLSFAVRFKPGYWRIIFAERGKAEEGLPSPGFVQAKVHELIGEGPAEIVWSSTFKIHCRNAPHFRVGRALLLGDAAHLNSPAGGQGMNAGIQDAHNLAWKLALALRGGNVEVLLNSYDQERYDAIVHGVDPTTDRLTKIGILAPVWLRSMAIGVLRLLAGFPRLQKRFAMGAGMLTHRYDQSDLIDSSGGRFLPDIPLGDGMRLRAALGRDGGLVEVVQNGAKVCVGESTFELSTSASDELGKVGGPYIAVRPDHVISYAGASRERAESFLAATKAQ